MSSEETDSESCLFIWHGSWDLQRRFQRAVAPLWRTAECTSLWHDMLKSSYWSFSSKLPLLSSLTSVPLRFITSDLVAVSRHSISTWASGITSFEIFVTSLRQLKEALFRKPCGILHLKLFRAINLVSVICKHLPLPSCYPHQRWRWL